MPDRYWLAMGGSIGFLLTAFFLSGFHHEILWRLERRRRGGMLR